jgi:HK97 gp10 family phage protein
VVAGPPAIQARVHGDENLVRTLRQAAAEVADMEDANRQAADLVAESGRGRAPVETGALRDSITVEVTREVGRAAAAVDYAGVQEWGWRARNIPAQPFLVPALLDNQGRIEDLYERALDAAIGKVKGA